MGRPSKSPAAAVRIPNPEFVSPADLPSNIVFGRNLMGGRGVWQDRFNSLQASPDNVLRLSANDQSGITQILWAKAGDFVYVKAFMPSEAQRALILLLREPRSLNELHARKLEVNVEFELQRLAQYGHAEFRASKWQLTEAGIADLIVRNPAPIEGA
jgi:hypothetical protein